MSFRESLKSETSSMITNKQIIAGGFLVGFPFVGLLLLLLINPVYEGYLFLNYSGLYGINLILVLQAINAFTLFVEFSAMNRIGSAPDERPSCSQRLLGILPILNIVFFTFPALYLVIFYPSVVIMMQQGQPL